MHDVVDLARRFIEVPSLTGDERRMAEECEQLLRRIGYSVELLPVQGDRVNVLARVASPRVLLCSHLDTVPPTLPVREDDEWLFGRGACDTKGILAAMVVAAESLLAEGVQDVGLLFVVGEETDSIGAKHANASLDLPDVAYTIVGEPTDSCFARAQKGAFRFTLSVRGRAAHSGYPEQGQSAILGLLDVLQKIREINWGEDPGLGRGTANIGVLQGGLRFNIVPAAAQAEVFVRIVDSVEATRRRVQKVVQACPLPIEWLELSSNEPQRLTTMPGAPETVVAFNTDVPHLTRFGSPLLMGPGSILDAHGPDERISKRELRDSVRAYREAVLFLRSQAR